MKTFKGEVTSISGNQVLVVTTNTQGRQGAGIAKWAHDNLGLPHGCSKGRYGRCYCIITKDLTKKTHPSIPNIYIVRQIISLYEHAYWEYRLYGTEFIVPFVAGSTPLSGYSVEDFAWMFSSIPIPENIIFEEGFAEILKKKLALQQRTAENNREADI